MSVVRTVLGDVDAALLGVTYAHEHLVIDGGRPVELFPDFLLADIDRMAAELGGAAAAGLRSAIDAMPCDCRAEPGQARGAVAPDRCEHRRRDGLHHERFYGFVALEPASFGRGGLADLFVADVVDGIDERDYGSPVVRRIDVRAGIVKVAGSGGGPSARDLPIFRAAAETNKRTGVPILTHCEEGTGALEQVRVPDRRRRAAGQHLAEPRRQGGRPRLPP